MTKTLLPSLLGFVFVSFTLAGPALAGAPSGARASHRPQPPRAQKAPVVLACDSAPRGRTSTLPVPSRRPRAVDGLGIDLRQGDRNRDGRLSLAEVIRRADRRFRRADVDRNGVLSRREHARALHARWTGDTNRDGRLSYVEHRLAVRRWFRWADANRDGYVTDRELRRARSRRVATPSPRWRA